MSNVKVQGDVEDASGQIAPNCKLFMFRRSDGTLLGSAVSDANGHYEMDASSAVVGETVFMVCLDNDEAPDFEGIVHDRIKIGNQTSTVVGCEGATDTVVLTGYRVLIWTNSDACPTVDIYVNDVLVAADVQADAYINQNWYTNQALVDNANQGGYSVSGGSDGSTTFYSGSPDGVKFRFVPKSDGLLNGTIYSAKDALTISSSNSNPTAYKDPETGILTFCLKGS